MEISVDGVSFDMTQLDPKRFTVIIIRLPEHFTVSNAAYAQQVAQQLQEMGLRNAVMIVPHDWGVEFAQEMPGQ